MGTWNADKANEHFQKMYDEVHRLHRQGKPTGTAALLANLGALEGCGIDWMRLRGDNDDFSQAIKEQPRLAEYLVQKTGCNVLGHNSADSTHQLRQEQSVVRAVSMLGKNPSVFRMSGDFTRQLLATEHEKAVVTNIHLPLPALILELEPCIELLNVKTGMHPLQSLALYEVSFGDGSRIINWVGQCGPKSAKHAALDDNYQCGSIMLDFGDSSLLTAEQAHDRAREVLPKKDAYRESTIAGSVDGERLSIAGVTNVIDRLVINTILYFSQERPSIRRASNNKAVGKSELGVAPARTKVRVGRRGKVRGPRPSVYTLGSGEGSVRVAYKTLVRGHWRHQPYGKGRLLRRTIWIKPHERNKDAPGEAAAHEYVKGGE